MKKLTILMLVLISLATGGLSSEVAADSHCKKEFRVDLNGAGPKATCFKSDPDAGSEHTSVDPEARWNRYCRYLVDTGGGLPYADGAVVRIVYNGPLSLERVEAFNLNPTGTYASFDAHCDHPSPGGSGFGGEFFYTVASSVSLVDLRAEAKARINIERPAIETNPSFTDRFTLVNIDTWLWAEPAYWVEQYASETAGFVTVEVFATPTEMTWTFSDSTTTTCNGPGRAWTRRAINPPCSVMFTQSSAGQPNDAYQATATVSWVFSWTVNGADQGEFDTPFLATTNFELQVGEIQSVSS